MQIAERGRIESENELVNFAGLAWRCGVRQIFSDEFFKTLQPLFLPFLEDAGLRDVAGYEIAADELVRIFKGDQVGFFLDDHDDTLVAVGVAADVAEAFAGGMVSVRCRVFVLVDKKAALANLHLAKVIDADGQFTDIFVALANQIEGEPNGLARSNGRQLGKFVGNFLDGDGKFHGNNPIILRPFLVHAYLTNRYNMLTFKQFEITENSRFYGHEASIERVVVAAL